MKINIKKRLCNKYFWISMLSLIVLLLNQLGVTLPFDLNEVGSTIISIFVALGIVVDNGTKGLGDNE